MRLSTKQSLSESFADVLAIIINDLEFENSVLLPEVLAIVESLQTFIKNAKAKEVMQMIIQIGEDSEKITPDLIVLLKDLQDILIKIAK